MKKKEVYYESGQALCWVEFKEMGCPITEDDAEKDYFLSKEEILKIAEKIKKEPK